MPERIAIKMFTEGNLNGGILCAFFFLMFSYILKHFFNDYTLFKKKKQRFSKIPSKFDSFLFSYLKLKHHIS